MRILMISSEVESLARTGGLGDVVEALSLALASVGAEVMVVTPLYGVSRVPRQVTRWEGTVETRWGWGPHDVHHVAVVELDPVRFPSGGSRRTCLVDAPALYQRHGLYGDAYGEFGDNAHRFAVMSRAALEISLRAWPDTHGPDVIHAHDWHATFAILYAKLVMGDEWARKGTVFTVHNLQFQGLLDEGALDRLHLPREAFRPEVLWNDGNVNLIKGATALADRITTVSPTYAREILTPEGGFGLDAHLRAHAARLRGILNGIDVERFDPRTDAAILSTYDAEGIVEGKAVCKAALALELGLDGADGPHFGSVGRLAWQKGIDLLVPLIGEIVDRGGRMVVVGQGDRDLEEQLLRAQEQFKGRVGVRIAFDPPMSRRIYSATDFFFVPSRFEPCGLTQMYAMRYGSIPIVTDVGGLHDTVSPIDRDRDTGVGLLAEMPIHADLLGATRDAFALWADTDAFRRAARRGMAEDFSWTLPAKEYLALYGEVLAR